MVRISGGAVLARSLRALNVDQVFTLQGGHLDAFLVACADHEISLTDTRGEASAGHAATAFARATGRVGVTIITAGPGFTNALTAMTDAWLDGTAVLFISGGPPLREVETNLLQGGFDQVAVAAPVTKWSHRVTNVERIPDLIDKAIRIAMTGRPGPVHLEMPIDIMFGVADDADLVLPSPSEISPPGPSASAIETMLDLLEHATRPVIIVGSGALSPACSALLQELAEITATPIATNNKALGAVPQDFPLYVGSVGAVAIAQMVYEAPADLVILVGARMGMLLGGRSGAIVPHTAKVVQIDIEGSEIGRLRKVDVGITADSAASLAAAVAHARERRWKPKAAWVETLKLSAQPMASFAEAPAETRPGMLHPFHAARVIAEALAPDTAIAWDGGETPAWFQFFIKSPGPGLAFGNGYLGTMGVGQGYAIGLATARPQKPVVLLAGDGASGFNIGEFDTMVRHRLPILMIIFNNASWGMSAHGQELVFGRQRTAAVKLAATDYDKVAAGFGCYAEKITSIEELGPAVKRAQAQQLPACLNVMIDPEVVHPLTTALVGRLDCDDEIAIPYYENIPLKR